MGALLDVSAGSDLNQYFLGLGLDPAGKVYSTGAGTPQNGPGTESAIWTMSVVVNSGIGASGYNIFETANGQWHRTFSVGSAGVITASGWNRIADFSGYVSSINGKHGNVTIAIDGD